MVQSPQDLAQVACFPSGYAEDSSAETDMNIVMNEAGGFIEIQGTAEGHAFQPEELTAMLELGKKGILHLIDKQTEALNRN